MTRATRLGALLALLALAACGADGPPERPAAQGAPRTGVTFGGEASFGVNL